MEKILDIIQKELDKEKERIERECKVPVHMSPMPLEAVVLGAGHCIEHYDALKNMFMGARR